MVEALVALILGLALLHLGLTTLHRLDRYEDRASRRQDALLSARVVSTVLRRELALGDPSVDWSVAGDSLVLRAFRGAGVVCSVSGPNRSVTVAFSGDRVPDASKDSVEVTTASGAVLIVPLQAVRSRTEACARSSPGEAVQEWVVDSVLPADAVIARPFESGSYHLSGAALRYRIGFGGRQPLTPEVWLDSGTGFDVADSTVRLTLEPRPGYGPALSEFLVWSSTP